MKKFYITIEGYLIDAQKEKNFPRVQIAPHMTRVQVYVTKANGVYTVTKIYGNSSLVEDTYTNEEELKEGVNTTLESMGA